MGREAELFKAAQTGNTSLLEKVFASYLKKATGGGHHGSTRNKLHPNIQDSAGSTLLHHAILNGHGNTVSLLLKCGASTQISDNSGSPPLHLAAWKGDCEIVQMLVTQGPSYANVNQQNDADDTALHLASQYGYAPVVEFLLQRHADPLLRNMKNETPLDLAAQYGHLSCVHYLISYSPETLRPTLKGFSPLHLAARNGHSLVALSLINAGISVNTVCERGTALHEAATCGKMETVELLLDKGANSDLKDIEGRTVMEVLEQYKANQAAEIRKKIQDHIENQERNSSDSNSIAPRSKSSRVVAVARTTSQPLIEGSSALAFSTGEHIQVERSLGSGVYVGSIHGNSGSFLAEDVLFYTEQDGELVVTEETELHMTRDPSPQVDEQGSSTISPSNRPLAPIPEKESGVQEETTTGLSPPPVKPLPKSSPENPRLRHPHSDSISEMSEEAHAFSNSVDHKEDGVFEMSTSCSQASSSTEVTSEPSETAFPIGKREEVKKMSKKEKRFQLSKDDGKYLELNPINPLQAKKEFGNTLRLNPVGPNFGGVASSEERQVITAHNSSAVPGPEGDDEDYMGSYYVLEVGNFDHPPSPSSSSELNTSPCKAVPSGPTSDSDSLVVAVPVEGQADYYMLNTDDPSLPNEGSQVGELSPTYSLVSNRQNYQNMKVFERSSAKIVEDTPPVTLESTNQSSGFKLHPHLIIANDEDLEKTRQTSYVGANSEGRTSAYENIVPPSDGSVVPLPAAVAVSEGVAPDPAGVDRTSGGTYENIKLLPSSPPDTSSTPNSTPSSTTVAERSGMRRSAQQRREVYEVVPLKGRKVNGVGGPNHSSKNPTTNACDLMESGIVENSGENPFAGLVISASEKLEGSSSFSEGPKRERAETIWDNQRVEHEWTQIDSLLQDMTGVIGDHSYPTSPTSPVKTPSSELVSWLKLGGLSHCASILELNGFDNLRFLGGNILAMDDLSDIGITAPEDQYNLMAAVSLLAPPLSVGHASTVAEWLGLLDLLHLEGKFVGYSLKKISTLWDIELSSVIGVEQLGYRKRLQFGISELRHAHPEWSGHNTFPSASPPKTKRSPLSYSSSSDPVSKISFLKDYRSLRSPPSDSTSPTLTIRTPADAQSFDGEHGQIRTPNLPSQTWKHDNDALISGSINYQIKYLGSVIIKNLHGKQSAEEACLKLRTSTANMQKIPDILLSISWKGVKFMDAQSKKVVSVHAIRDVSCCSSDIEDRRVFAYITKERTTGKNYSHVFMATSEDVSNDIRMTLAQAFEICYQKVMRARLASSNFS